MSQFEHLVNFKKKINKNNLYYFDFGDNTCKQSKQIDQLPYNLCKYQVENSYNTKTIKWNINKSELEKIQIIENLMRKEFKNIDIDEIKSKIISKPNYPSMIMTKINKNKTSNDIIKHESGEITSFEEINKIFFYDVVLIVSNLFLKNEGDKNILYYTLETESIDKKGLCVT